MADMAAVYTITGVDNLSGPAGAAEAALGRVEAAGGRFGSAMLGVGAAVAKATVAIGAIGFAAAAAGITASVTAASSFTREMSAVGAVSGATGEQMKQLHDLALQLGKDTAFSASESAAGIEELAKAGVSIQDIMAGGAKAALDLAAAGGISVADAATIASNAMNAFSISGANVGHVADMIAGAANASAIDVHEFGFSLAASGAVAAQIGLSFDDLSVAIAEMGNAGIKGSDAGTSLKTMLLNLQPSSKAAKDEMQQLGIITADGSNKFFDAQGHIKSLADVQQVLQDATAGLSDEQKIAALQTMFGTDAIRAATIMTKAGAAGYNELATSIGKVTAAGVGDERMNNLAGSVERLKGTVETAAITFGEHLLPPLRRLVDMINNGLGGAMPVFDRLGTVMGAAFDALITKVQAASPRLLGLASTVLMLGQTALPVFAAAVVSAAGAAERGIGRLLGLSIADYGNQWDLLGGTVTRAGELARTAIGGIVQAVQQGWPAVEGAITRILPIVTSLGRAFADNVATQIRFVTTSVIPPLLSIFEQTAGFATATLIPAMGATSAVLRDQLGQTLAWLAATAWPPLLSIAQQTAAFWTSTLLPAIAPLATALRTTLGDTLQWLATTGWPALASAATIAVNTLTTYVLPAIAPVAAFIRTELGTAITWISTTGWPAFLVAAGAVATFLTGTVLPAVQGLATWLQTNVPPAIETVLTAFTALRTRLAPIVQAVFAGDIKIALAGLGAAFTDFATLVVGWLGEQVAKVDWLAVWQQAKDVALALGRYVAGLAVDFATWLGAQAAKVDWAGIWSQAKDAAVALGTWLKGKAVDFVTWLGDQASKIDWAGVWSNVTAAAAALAAYVKDLAVDFTAWLGEQAGKVDWEGVWQQTKLTARMLVDVIDEKLAGLDAALTGAFNTWIGSVTWTDVGTSIGQALIGPVQDGTTAAVTGIDRAAVVQALGDLLGGILTGAWDQAYANWQATKPGDGIVNTIIQAIQRLRVEGTAEYNGFWQDAQGAQDAGTAGLAAGLLAHHAEELAAWQAHHAAVLAESQALWADANGASTAGQAAETQSWDAWLAGMLASLEAWAGRAQTDYQQVWTDAQGTTTEGTSIVAAQIAAWLSKTADDMSKAWDEIWARTGEAWQAIWGVVTEKAGAISGLFTQIIPEWVQAGTDMAKGLVDAVTAGLANLVETVVGPIKSAIDQVRSLLPGGGAPAAPSAGGPQNAGPAGGSNMSQQMPASYTEEWERKAYAAAIAAGHDDPVQFVEQIREESGGNPTAYNRGSRATGIAQIIPSTAAAWGVDPTDPDASLRVAAEHAAAYRRQYGPQLGLAAYNAGEGNVARYGMGVFDPSFARGETMRYEAEINARTAAIHGQEQPPDTSGAVNYAGQVNARPPQAFNGQNVPIGNQFDLGLPWAEAEAACGPAAVALFVEATGRTPNRDEVLRISAKNGWSAAHGMGGPGAFMKTLGDLGVQYAQLPATAQAAQQSAAGGNLTAISTGGGNVPLSAGHYFVAQGFDPTSGTFDLGETGGPDPNNPAAQHALVSGSRFMTAEQITALAGPINGVIELLNQVPAVADAAATSVDGTATSLSDVATNAGDAADPLAAVSQDDLPAVTAAAGDTAMGLEGLQTDGTAALEGLSTDGAAALDSLQTDGAAAIDALATDGAPAFAGIQTDGTTALDGLQTDGSEALAGLQTDGTAALDSLQTDGMTAFDGLQTSGTEAAQGLQTDSTEAMKALQADGTTAIQGLQADGTEAVQGMQTDTTAAAVQMAADVGAAATTMSDDTVAAASTMVSDVSTAIDGLDDPTQQASDSFGAVGSAADDATGPVGDFASGVDDAGSAAGKARSPVSSAGQAISTTGKSADDAAGPVGDFSDELGHIKPPNLSGFIGNLKDIQKAAEAAKKEVGNLLDAKGAFSGIGKASGGPVFRDATYLVGEEGDEGFASAGGMTLIGRHGPELFSPPVSGVVIPHHRLRGLAMGGYVQVDGQRIGASDSSIDYDKLAAAIVKAGAKISDRHFNLTVNTSASYEPIVDDFAIIEAQSLSGL